MKRAGCLLLALALLFTASGFALGADRAGAGADCVGGGVTLYLETPLSAGAAQAPLEQESTQDEEMTFTVWGELAEQLVSDPDLGQRVKADVLILLGACEGVLHQGNALSAGDTEGCLLGEETAWELFGSTGVVGDTVRIGDETRTIRGIVHRPDRGVVITGSLEGIVEDAQETACYDRITLSSEQPADGDSFFMQNGLEGEVLRLDYLRSLSWLLELIPGKWSDFSGWKENWKDKQQDFELIMQVHKNSCELYYEKQCLVLIWNRAMQVVCVWLAAVYLFRACDGIFSFRWSRR